VEQHTTAVRYQTSAINRHQPDKFLYLEFYIRQEPDKFRQEPDKFRQVTDKFRQEPDKFRQEPDKSEP